MSIGQASVNVSNYLILTTPLPAWSAATVCGWARVDAVGTSGTYSAIVTISDTTTGYTGIYRNNTTGNLVFYNSTGGFASSELSACSVGDWVFWAITQNGTSGIGYVSVNGGSLVASSTVTLPSSTIQDIRLSRDQGGAGNGSGSFYNYVRIFGAVLDSTELAAEQPSAVAVRSANLLDDDPLLQLADLIVSSWVAVGTLSDSTNSPYVGGSVPRFLHQLTEQGIS